MSTMRAKTAKSGLAPGVVGTFILLQVVFVSAAFSADANNVYFAGRRLDMVCSFKERLGYPCPTCGMTRSVVLASHGRLLIAAGIHPAGPLAVIGLGLSGLLMIFLSIYNRSR